MKYSVSDLTIDTARAGVDPSLGRTHAFDGWARMTTQGVSGAGTAQRNAAGKTSLFFTPRSLTSVIPWWVGATIMSVASET